MSSLAGRKRERSSRRGSDQGGPPPKLPSSAIESLDAVRKICRSTQGHSYAVALDELANGLRQIFSAGWVITQGAGPGFLSGVAPPESDVHDWLEGIDLDVGRGTAPKSFPAPAAGLRSREAGVGWIVVVPIDQPDGLGSIILGLTGGVAPSGDKVTCIALAAEMVGSALWRVAWESPPMEVDSGGTGILDLTTSEIIALAAHELRTPLTPITMLLQSLERKARTAHFDVDPIVRTRRHVNRLAQMISDFLDLTRMREGRLVLTPVLLELTPCIAQAVSRFRELNPARAVELVTPEESLVIVADEERILQSVSSLIDHVVRVTPAESVIHIALDRRGDRAAITLSAARSFVADPSLSAQPFTTKAKTFSLAVLLAHAVWMRFGGTFSLPDLDPAKIIVEATLPLSASDKG